MIYCEIGLNCQLCYSDCKYATDLEPTIYAKWIPKYHETWKYYCTNCNGGTDVNYNYCPHCGAKTNREIVGVIE